MLWSAADYKLPANQEPALSEELENMLISMTQDAHWVRPSASDVLQVCQSGSPHQLDPTPKQIDIRFHEYMFKLDDVNRNAIGFFRPEMKEPSFS